MSISDNSNNSNNSNNKDIYSATSLMHYIRKDGIIDYIELREKGKRSVDIYIDSSNINVKRQRINNSSFEYIMNMGNEFEESIIKEIKRITDRENIIKIESNNLTISEHYGLTRIKIEENRYEIIINGLLINLENNTYGKPDIIVKGRWLKKNIIGKIPEDIEEELYYIIDVKCSSINLINGGEYNNKIITNSVSMDGYKIQILVYKKALESIIKRNIRYGFIIGKKYIEKKNIYDSLENIGIIDYDKNNIDKKLEEAIRWKKWIRDEYNNIEVEDIKRKKIIDLFPNMKNSYDMNYYGKKRKIAEEIKEITLLWHCGIKQRNNAIENKIYFLDDKKIKPEKLGFEDSSKKYKIIEKMIEMNRDENKRKIYLDRMNNVNNWQKEYKYEYYVDFEMYNSEEKKENILYMIGVMYKNNYTVFIMDNKKILENKDKNIEKDIKSKIVRCKDEEEIIRRFDRYIKSNKKREEIRVYHWSGCEPRIYENKKKKYNIRSEINWMDILEVFKDEEYPIIIKNTYNFSLKSIIKKMDEYGMIDVRWGEELQDGLLSAFLARDLYENRDKENNIDFESIIRYNMIDCKAVREILRYIREYIKN